MRTSTLANAGGKWFFRIYFRKQEFVQNITIFSKGYLLQNWGNLAKSWWKSLIGRSSYETLVKQKTLHSEWPRWTNIPVISFCTRLIAPTGMGLTCIARAPSGHTTYTECFDGNITPKENHLFVARSYYVAQSFVRLMITKRHAHQKSVTCCIKNFRG